MGMFDRWLGRGGDVSDSVLEADIAREERESRWRRWHGFLGAGTFAWIGAALAVLVVLYYAVGALWISRIDDDPDFGAAMDTQGSRAVAVAAGLIGRELDYGWTANDPFFQPGVLLDNMPNFQQGIVSALSRFAVEMGDQIGRARGSSQADADLEKAAGLLKYPGTVWLFDFSTSWAPTASSESQYGSAARALLAYNRRLASGQAVFERRSDNLQGTLERIAADLGSVSAVIDRHLQLDPIYDTRVDDIFYANKGRLYAYYLLLRALGDDFAPLVGQRDLQVVWGQMLESFRQAALLDPPVVLGGAPDSILVPSHLAAQGFYLLRARTQLKEVSNVLQK